MYKKIKCSLTIFAKMNISIHQIGYAPLNEDDKNCQRTNKKINICLGLK